MRKTLAFAALAVGVAAGVLPVTSASAYCSTLVYDLTGRCTNHCVLAGQAYHEADRASGGRLPDASFECPM